ncbi:MAG: ribonuclease P protein component [Rhodobacteraceae bacterium]|nr:ribonuclease P protein component [Paracoccaceae bacterium]
MEPGPDLTTLARRGDFLAAARAERAATPGFVLQARRRPEETDALQGIRVGFTCSKKVGNAVARNRAKRRLRALARSVLARRGRPGWDYVLIGRERETATRDFARMTRELATALDRVHGRTGSGA